MAHNYQNKSTKELLDTLQEKRIELREFRFNIAGSKIRNVKEGRDIRREIARILTVLTSKSS